MHEIAVLLKVLVIFGMTCPLSQLQYNPSQSRLNSVYLTLGTDPTKPVHVIWLKPGMSQKEERVAILHELVRCSQVELAVKMGANLPHKFSPRMETEAETSTRDMMSWIDRNGLPGE